MKCCDKHTKQVEKHGAAVLSVGVCSKVNVLLAKLGKQLGAGARQLDAHTLHAVAKLGADCLHDGDGAVFVQVDLLHAAHVEVFEEARVGHARRGHARTVVGAGGAHACKGGEAHAAEKPGKRHAWWMRDKRVRTFAASGA